MDAREKQMLIARQLKDIVVQADSILTGNDGEEAIEAFSKYSVELKKYLVENCTNEMILERLAQVPYIDYKKIRTTIGGAMLSTYFGRLGKYRQKQRLLTDIRTARGLYSSIEFLFKSEMG